MKRGEIWIGSSRGELVAKPRPYLVVQNEKFFQADLIVACPFSSTIVQSKSFRPIFEPSVENGMILRSQLLIDVISTQSVKRFSKSIGRLSSDDLAMVDAILVDFLGLRNSE